jgi:hypothetical protein
MHARYVVAFTFNIEEYHSEWKSNTARDKDESFPETIMKNKCGGPEGFREAKESGDIWEVSHRVWAFKSGEVVEERGSTRKTETCSVP